MERAVVILLIGILCFGFVVAEGEWGDIGVPGADESLPEPPPLAGEGDEVGIYVPPVYESVETKNVSGDASEYTLEFYWALGIGLVGVLILVLFLYLFFRRPRNGWEK